MCSTSCPTYSCHSCRSGAAGWESTCVLVATTAVPDLMVERSFPTVVSRPCTAQGQCFHVAKVHVPSLHHADSYSQWHQDLEQGLDWASSQARA